MTDIHTWRRNTHLSASRIAELAGYGSSPEDISLSTSPNEHARPRLRPRRSLASFASYLSTNRTASGDKSEWPSVDWSHINVNDHIYRPEPDSMCATLQQHVLNNPSTGLPAQYNSFVLHILESYYRLKDDKGELERRLEAEEAHHRIVVDELNLTIQSLLATSEPSIPMTAVRDFSVDAGDMLAGFPEKTRKSSGKLDSLLSKFDTGYSRKHKRNAMGQGVSTGKQYANHLRHCAHSSQYPVKLNQYDHGHNAVGNIRLQKVQILTITLCHRRLLLRRPNSAV